MKKYFMMAALMLAVLPTEAQENVKYSIDGISKENGKTVVLRNRRTNLVVDSAIVANGRFSMTASDFTQKY